MIVIEINIILLTSNLMVEKDSAIVIEPMTIKIKNMNTIVNINEIASDVISLM
ncbi:MAG TPA: hypothetical protein VK125_02620 [Bacillota bacterium]|nr:hypothetical protein [Bacillota bacterium]